MNTRAIWAAVLLLSLTAALPAVAEHHESKPGAFAKNVTFTGDRAVQLAEAIPADDYGWRPMEGVHSVAEAMMHMAGANYFFAVQMGTPVPDGVDTQAIGKITDKNECVKVLKASLEHLGKAFDSVADPSKEMEIFGEPGTVMDMMLIAAGHVHQHYGQLIAYARSNEVVPPWSQPVDEGDGEG